MTDAAEAIAPADTCPDPLLMRFVGVMALLGVVGLVGSNIWGTIVVPNHDWMADTVSDLAAGKYESIQDVGLYTYAGALLALAIGTAHLHPGTRSWTGVSIGLALLALCVTIIAARNEYGDGDNEGVEVHIYIVYAMGALFTAVFVLASWVRTHFRILTLSRVCAVLWSIGAPVFFMLPTGWDGGFERALGIVTAVWVTALGFRFIQMARAA